MRIGGHGLKEHLRLLFPLLVLIGLVWLIRLLLSAIDAPGTLVRIFSVTGAQSIAILLAVVLMHVRRFGGYSNVIVVSFLLATFAQLLIIVAIVFAELTGTENVFTAPEFSVPEPDPYHLRHIRGHLTFGIGGGTLTGSALGCVVLWIMRKVVPVPDPKTTQPARRL